MLLLGMLFFVIFGKIRTGYIRGELDGALELKVSVFSADKLTLAHRADRDVVHGYFYWRLPFTHVESVEYEAKIQV